MRRRKGKPGTKRKNPDADAVVRRKLVRKDKSSNSNRNNPRKGKWTQRKGRWILDWENALGAGAEGTVLPAPRGQVYKITHNLNEIEVADYLLRHPNLHPMLPKVYEINLDTGEGYGYRREDLPDFNLLSDTDDIETLDFLLVGSAWFENSYQAVLLERLRHLSEHGIPAPSHIVKMALYIITNLVVIQRNFGISIGDIHVNNLGMRKSQIVVRDIGHGFVKHTSLGNLGTE